MLDLLDIARSDLKDKVRLIHGRLAEQDCTPICMLGRALLQQLHCV